MATQMNYVTRLDAVLTASKRNPTKAAELAEELADLAGQLVDAAQELTDSVESYKDADNSDKADAWETVDSDLTACRELCEAIAVGPITHGKG